MKRKIRAALLALSLSCAAAITNANPAVADDPVPACLDIVKRHDWSLVQNTDGGWVLTVTQELASPSCTGGATYSLHTFAGSGSTTVAHSAPDGLGTNMLTFSVPVEVYGVICPQLGLIDQTRMAVKAHATTNRGSHGDNTVTATFNNDPELCGSPGAAGWS